MSLATFKLLTEAIDNLKVYLDLSTAFFVLGDTLKLGAESLDLRPVYQLKFLDSAVRSVISLAVFVLRTMLLVGVSRNMLWVASRSDSMLCLGDLQLSYLCSLLKCSKALKQRIALSMAPALQFTIYSRRD